MREGVPFARKSSVIVGALFVAWVALLAAWSGIPSRFGARPDKVMPRLSALRATLEKHKGIFGEYPSTGGGWVLVGDGASQDEGVKTFPVKLASFPAFTDPSKAPAVSVIYASDGKDYKLLAHVADKGLCVAVREDAPSLVDPERSLYLSGFLRGPSWPVVGGEVREAEEFMKKKGTYRPRLDKGVSRYVRGTCWAFGYWTPGAASW